MKFKLLALFACLLVLPLFVTQAKGESADIFEASFTSLPLAPGYLDCTGPYTETVNCGDTVNGDTTGAPSWGSIYPCWSSYNMSGPEKVHVLTLSGPANITATLTAGDTNLDVLILSDCDTNACVVADDTSAVYNNAAPGTYYILVDGRDGYAGTYTLTINCELLPTPTPTVTPTPPPVPTTSPFGVALLIIAMTLILGMLTWKFSARRG